jgi:transposase
VDANGGCCPQIFQNGKPVMHIGANGAQNKTNNTASWKRHLKNVVGAVRQSLGRKPTSRFLIVDAQSVKNTDTAESKGYDAGKKISGIKRHIAVDTNGLPHAIHVTTANITDRAGALEAFALHKDALCNVKTVLADGGYTGEPFASGVKEVLGATVEIAKRNELHTFAVIPKRWVVERSFAWLEKCRRLWKNCKRKLDSSLNMIVFAFLVLLLKRS